MAFDPLYVEEEVPIRDDIAHRLGVRSVSGRTTLVVAGSLSASGFRSYVVEYDSAGIRMSHERFDDGGRLVRRWFYDTQGKLRQDIIYNAKGDIDYWFEVESDDHGWTEKRMCSPPNQTGYRITADRDGSGQLGRATYHDPDGQTIRVDSYRYDDLGFLVHITFGDLGECLFEYDANRNLRRRSKILPGMNEYGDVHEFTYDDRGLLIRMDHLHLSATTFEFTIV